MGSQRYGNKAFANWHAKLVEVCIFFEVSIIIDFRNWIRWLQTCWTIRPNRRLLNFNLTWWTHSEMRRALITVRDTKLPS
jgi:hypothetical protein